MNTNFRDDICKIVAPRPFFVYFDDIWAVRQVQIYIFYYLIILNNLTEKKTKYMSVPEVNWVWISIFVMISAKLWLWVHFFHFFTPIFHDFFISLSNFKNSSKITRWRYIGFLERVGTAILYSLKTIETKFSHKSTVWPLGPIFCLEDDFFSKKSDFVNYFF